MEKRYTALRTIATIYKILGIVVAVVTVLAVLVLCVASVLGGAAVSNLERNMIGSRVLDGVLGGVLAGGLGLIYGGVVSLTLYAFGEAIYLLIALEENTRATAMYL